MTEKKYKGVYYNKVTGFYQAHIFENGVNKFLGCNKDAKKCFDLYQNFEARQFSKKQLKEIVYRKLRHLNLLHREKKQNRSQIDRYYAEVLHQSMSVCIKHCTNNGGYTVDIRDYDFNIIISKLKLESIYNELKNK